MIFEMWLFHKHGSLRDCAKENITTNLRDRHFWGGGAQRFWIACYCSIPYHTLTNTWSQQDEHASLCRRLGSRIPTLLKSNLAWDSPRGNKKMKNRIFSSCFMNQSKMLWRQVRELNILFNLETSIWKAGNFPLRVNWIWCQIHTHGINWLLYFST